MLRESTSNIKNKFIVYVSYNISKGYKGTIITLEIYNSKKI